MPETAAQLALHLAAMVLAAGATYGAIRSDLRHLNERVGQLERRQDKILDHLLNHTNHGGNNHA